MKAKTNNQIREEMRKRLASKYAADLEAVKKEKHRFWEMYVEEEKKSNRLAHENNELKQKLEALEDWNRRLLEFMDLPDKERKTAYKQYVESKKLDEVFSGWFDFFGNYADWLRF